MAEADPSSVKLEKKKCVISIADIQKNIDVNNNGIIDDEEAKIINTLKAMDVDGDGNISLKELVNIGKALNTQQSQTRLYKRMFWGVLLLAFLAMCATFLACLAAVEAAKDNRPDQDGTLKTVVTAGQEPKVVNVGEHFTTVSMSELHKATYDTLRGVTDLGFKLSNRFYQYTITGFEQEFNTDGSASVRFYSSRGDTIFISSTAAKLEKATGAIDIKDATTANRHLLASLTGQTQLLAAGTVSSKTADGAGILDEATVASIATEAANNDPNGTLSPSSGALGLKLQTPCPNNASKEGVDPVCICNQGFVEITPYTFNVTTESWDGKCDLASQLEMTSCWYDDWEKVVTCECPYGYVGNAAWNSSAAQWEATCAMGALPESNNVTLVVEEWKEMGYYEPRLHYRSVWISCPMGMSGNFWFDYDTQSWKGEKCTVLQCPEGSTRYVEDDGQVYCNCSGLYAGTGYKFEYGYFGAIYTDDMYETEEWWKAGCQEVRCPWASSRIDGTESCKCDKIGYEGDVLNLDREAANNWTWPMFTTQFLGGEVEHRDWCEELECPANSYRTYPFPDYHPDCACEPGFRGNIRWNTNSSSWVGECKPIVCPEGSYLDYHNVGDDGDPIWEVNCHCEWPYKGTVHYNKDSKELEGQCEMVSCPDPLQKLMVEEYMCWCSAGYSGAAVWNWTSESCEADEWNGDGTTGCSPRQCPQFPPTNPVELKNGVMGCECGLGFNGTVEYVAEWQGYEPHCEPIACPDDAMPVIEGDTIVGCQCYPGMKGSYKWGYDNATRTALAENITASQNGTRPPMPEKEWIGQCEVARCPQGTIPTPGFPMCMCKPGSVGSVQWLMGEQSFATSCVPLPCPDGFIADGMMNVTNDFISEKPKCKLQRKGYTGEAEWMYTNVTVDEETFTIFMDGAYDRHIEGVECPQVKTTVEQFDPFTGEKSCFQGAETSHAVLLYHRTGAAQNKKMEYKWDKNTQSYASTATVVN